MQTIHLLSDRAIDQIAAGEVIEGPASVVKELIENALDSGAKKISVEITGGGLKAVCVSDDGKGMSRLDAQLCIKRHATSKIRRTQDLLRLKTMGFRGEALAAISSISKMTIRTALDGETGTKLEVEKGEILKVGLCARTQGTTVEVRDLFYNVPARKKFQKSQAAISAEIFRLVTVMSLGNPQVHFELISNKRKSLQTPFSNDLKLRASQLLGEEFMEKALSLDFREGPLHFSGFIGDPRNARNNKMGQHLFINRRAVGCEPICEAIRKGYGTRLDERRHPVFLLHLDVPADLVDVNVHPQKLQVRLRDDALFREKIQRAIESSFVSIPKRESLEPSYHPPPFYADIPLRFHESVSASQFDLPIAQDAIDVIGLFSHFLLVQENKGVLIVDLCSACSRLIYDQMAETREKRVVKQALLIPFSVCLTPIEAAMVMTHIEAIEEMGFSVRPIGKDAFMIEALPLYVDESDVKDVISQVAKELQSFIAELGFEQKRRRKLASLAARFSKNKKQFSLEEAKHIYQELKKSNSPAYCPKGKPITIYWSQNELESQFTAHQKIAKSVQK